MVGTTRNTNRRSGLGWASPERRQSDRQTTDRAVANRQEADVNTNLRPMRELDLRSFTFIKTPNLRDQAHRFTLANAAPVDMLVAEVSDLGKLEIEPIYHDACDVGIAIKSHHTGRVERFAFTGTDRRDGEIVAWNFAAVSSDCRARKVVIFND